MNISKRNKTTFRTFKSLFFEDEIDRVRHLEQKVHKLSFEFHTLEEIHEKLQPLLDDKLLQQLYHNEQEMVDALAENLALIIEKSAIYDFSHLSHSLHGLISKSITKNMEENKDKMVDAMYPIMGSLISKYVSSAIQEMMETINNKIEEGLSFDRYKRKIKAKVSGVSEAELLLEESNEALIRSLFVIHKESALLICEAHVQDEGISDPHMVASMASAIKDFVNDWIKNHEESSEIQLLSYGNATLYIESAGSVYLIAFLYAEPDHEQRKEINICFSKIIKENYAFLQDFDGDDSANEIDVIKEHMYSFLNKDNIATSMTKESYVLKYVMFTLGFFVLVYVGFVSKDYYTLHTLEKMLYNKTNEHIHLSTEEGILTLNGYINHIDHSGHIEKLLHAEGYVEIQNKLLISSLALDKKVQRLEDEIKVLKQMITSKVNQ